MFTDYKDRSLWDQPVPILGGKTLREEFKNVGSSTYDEDAYLAGDYGDELMRHSLTALNFSDPQDPALDAYWWERGLKREFHKGADRSHDWVIYVPRSASLPENAGKNIKNTKITAIAKAAMPIRAELLFVMPFTGSFFRARCKSSEHTYPMFITENRNDGK